MFRGGPLRVGIKVSTDPFYQAHRFVSAGGVL